MTDLDYRWDATSLFSGVSAILLHRPTNKFRAKRQNMLTGVAPMIVPTMAQR
jgi:hypothetical protein